MKTMKTLKIPENLHKWLKDHKAHRREPLYEVLERLLEGYDESNYKK